MNVTQYNQARENVLATLEDLILLLNALMSALPVKLQTAHVQGPIVNATAFESLAVHPITKVFPMAPETEVDFPLGGLNTSTSTDPGVAMSAAVTAAANW